MTDNENTLLYVTNDDNSITDWNQVQRVISQNEQHQAGSKLCCECNSKQVMEQMEL